MTQKKQAKEPQAEETTGQGNPELVGQPSLPTPGQAEGDRATVEEDLQQKARNQRTGSTQGGAHEA